MSLVSVIIPNYNHARFLVQRIDTVLNQSFQDFELIILDDNSTDNSSEIIKQYSVHDKISHVVFNEQNSGSAFKQWQKGIALAKGEWIWIAESDDYCDRDLLDNLVRQTEISDRIVVSYCQSNFCAEGKPILPNMFHYTNQVSLAHWTTDYVNNGLDEIEKYLLYINSIPNASAVLFKKEAYKLAAKDFESMKQCGDWLFWIQLLKSGNIAFCAKSLNYFRAHGATTRVLNSTLKQLTRIEEEYTIVSDIKSLIGPRINKRANQRLAELLAKYAQLFTKSDIYNMLIKFKFNRVVPFYKLVYYKIIFFLKKPINKLAVKA